MDIHLRDLRYFLAVAEARHFTRAAETLYISQPALSKQIRMLERNLGVALFERDHRQVRLTPAGRELVDHARQILGGWDRASAAVEAAKLATAATLAVGMSTSPGRDGLLPAIRARFSASLPEAELTLRQLGWADPTAGLADGSTDVAFVWLPLPDPDRFAWEVIAQEPCLVALPAGHRFADQREVELAELLPEPFLALPADAGPLRDYWLATDHRDGRPARIGAEIASSDETYEALVTGLGVCLLASGNAPSLLRGGVVTRPVRGFPAAQLALAWRRNTTNPLIPAYVDAARRVVGAAGSSPRPA